MAVTDALYVAFLLGGTLYLIYASYREFTDRGFEHEISVVTGTVMREQQRSETKLSGTISGGGQMAYGGSQVHANISSRTTRFQEIFLALPDGKEAHLDFENCKIPCREQHRLSVVGVRRRDGPWCDCAFHNHTTSETLVQRDEIFDTLKCDAPARIGARWGLFVAAVALITQWDAGELVEGQILVNVLASGVLGILAGVVVFAIFWLPVRRRTRARCAAAERDIRDAINVAERRVQAEG
jgi:hypothetical protein